MDATDKLTTKQAKLKDQIDQYQKEVDDLIKKRKETKPKITIESMPEDRCYNQLKTESKMFMNIIKMICYGAESSLANLLPSILQDERRMCLKQMMQNNADIIPNYQNNTLTITLHAMSANRFNKAITQLCKTLNDTETIFPGTDLKMIFETTPIGENSGDG